MLLTEREGSQNRLDPCGCRSITKESGKRHSETRSLRGANRATCINRLLHSVGFNFKEQRAASADGRQEPELYNGGHSKGMKCNRGDVQGDRGVCMSVIREEVYECGFITI